MTEIPGWGWPGSFSLEEKTRALQQGMWVDDLFVGEPSDGTKSGSSSWMEVVSGGGLSQAGSTTQPTGSTGAALLRVPARAAPAAADGAGLRLRTVAWGIIRPDDMVGRVRSIARIYLTNPPQVGSDYLAYMGVIGPMGNQAEPIDGFYLFLDDGSPNWILRHQRAGAPVIADTGLAAVPGAWQTLAVEANVETGIVAAYGADDGDEIAELATVTPANIQPNDGCTSLIALHNGGNVTLESDMSIDYLGFGVQYGVAR